MGLQIRVERDRDRDRERGRGREIARETALGRQKQRLAADKLRYSAC